MANMAQYEADNVLGVLRGTTHPAAPTTLYLALFTSSPGPIGSGTEVSGGGYARLALTTSSAWTAIGGSPPTTPRSISNAADLTYPTSTAAWGKIIGWSLQSAATAGNRYAFGDFDPASQQDVPTGKFYRIKAGLLVISQG